MEKKNLPGGPTFHRKVQQNGPVLSYRNTPLLEQDGCYFKDLSRTGKLLPYEDWRLPAAERAGDLAGRLSMEEMAGLMLISGHQLVPGRPFGGKVPTYEDKPYDQQCHAAWALTDQQKEMIVSEKIRFLLQAGADSAEDSVRWNNELQALCEEQPFGIPAAVATDPRHGASSSMAEFKSANDTLSKWPEGIGMTAVADPQTVKQFAEIASREYRAMGISVALGPQIDLATEPRWMRMEDTLGGDVEAAIAYTKAYCDGMQTTDGTEQSPDPGWGKESVLAMVKHWPGGGPG